MIYCNLVYGDQDRPFTVPMFTNSLSGKAATRNQRSTSMSRHIARHADGITFNKLVKPDIFTYFTLTATDTSSPTSAPRMFLLRKQLTSCLSLKLLLLREDRLSPRPAKLPLRLVPWLNRRGVSGILMESQKLVTLSLTLLKRIPCPRNGSPVLAPIRIGLVNWWSFHGP